MPSSIAVADGSDLTYGGSVTFDTVVGDLPKPGKGDTYITVVCRQGGTVVYQYSSYDLGFTFPLIDQQGQGLDWPGGAAEGLASLRYRDEQGKKHTIVELATTEFHVEG